MILGGPDMYINKGSTINLTCIIKNSPEPPAAIYWTHNNEVINILIHNSYRGVRCSHRWRERAQSSIKTWNCESVACYANIIILATIYMQNSMGFVHYYYFKKREHI
jgi:hypothetical protein